MANFEKINGVVKETINSNQIKYYFPTCYIFINIADDSMIKRPSINSENQNTVSFSELTDNLGATDIEEYVDLLAEQGFFFDNVQKVDLGFGANLDASGRLRVSQLNTQLDIKQFKDNQPLLIDRENVGGATQTWDTTEGVDMVVSANLDAAISESFQSATYFSGKSQLGEITFSEGQNQTNVVKRVGYFSSNTVTPFDSTKDGLWYEADGTDYRFRIQKGGVDILNVAQADWNINKANWFDASKFNVFVFQFLYLGGTAVRLGFINEGVITWCHQYNHAGLVAGTFVNTPQQPVRYEIRSSGGAGTLKQVCAQIASEGSRGEAGINSFISSIGQNLSSSANNYAVLAFRLKAAYKDISIIEEKISFNAITNDDFVWRLCRNPTFASTPTFTDKTNSALQVYTGNIQISAFGYELDGGVVAANSASTDVLSSKIKPGIGIDGTPDQFVIVINPKSNNASVDTTITLTELR